MWSVRHNSFLVNSGCLLGISYFFSKYIPEIAGILLVNCVQLPDLWFPDPILVSSLQIRVTATFLSCTSGCQDYRGRSTHVSTQPLNITRCNSFENWTSSEQLGSLSPTWALASLVVVCSDLLVRWPFFLDGQKHNGDSGTLHCLGHLLLLRICPFLFIFTIKYFMKLKHVLLTFSQIHTVHCFLIKSEPLKWIPMAVTWMLLVCTPLVSHTKYSLSD